MPRRDVALQQHHGADQKRENCRIFRTVHRPLARHGARLFALPQRKPRLAKPPFALVQAWRHPTMHPPDIDDKYDFIRVFSRNGYEYLSLENGMNTKTFRASMIFRLADLRLPGPYEQP
jgi:hypothetical protein